MRALPVLLAVLLAAPAAVAQPALPPQAPPAQAAPAGQPAPTAADIDALQQRLLASQQVIATLQRELAEAKSRSGGLEQCRLRNGRLVSIGRQLIDAYARRYGQLHRRDPLQVGRRKFEFELQALSDAVYDNKVDVPLRTLPGGTAITGEPEKAD
jgi:septal ring factor EnvC (AmiA/AmiB activator)